MAPENLDIASAESQWRARFAAMKAALAELGIQPSSGPGHGGPGGDDHADEAEDEELLSPRRGRGRDVWDFITDDEGGSGDEYGDGADEGRPGFGLGWLRAQCAAVAARTDLEAEVLADQIRALLTSGQAEAELQSQLVDLVGVTEAELITELSAHRADIVRAINAAATTTTTTTATGSGQPRGDDGLPRLLTKAQREDALRRQDHQHKTAGLDPVATREEARYPHVYKSYHAGNTLSFSGTRYGLPVGSERREREKYEEYFIPAGNTGRPRPGTEHTIISIKDMDGLCRGTFRGYDTLNRMQSLVYPVAYRTNENMLICAPTGAGKTDAAMLTILNCVGQHAAPNPQHDPAAASFRVSTDDFKIVYVAPMKALAAEITDKLGRRLSWLGVRVREYTGDMQLTRAEVVRTQIVVTTPEKWDVITRKGTGDTELVRKVRLLIIDEVHMLHDERGAVLESLVARTQRQVESTQSPIRIVGLSATLPNYVDVADFLRVNRFVGLFYFDASFRPVPLEQRFVGVKGKAGTRAARENMDAVAFDKVREMLEQGHQVMVFVHSRRDTTVTATMLHERATEEQCAELFEPPTAEVGPAARAAAASSSQPGRSSELRSLLAKGLGVHHAGLPRSDRTLTERLFEEGAIRVLCCTATLAWGVNLPAAAVVIKGTQVYSAAVGRFVDLGILDVLQIFGRAGRPQFEDVGIGIICTTQDRLTHYLAAVTDQQPIESRFSARLVDNLNAEVALGTVTTLGEAARWIGYSYLHVRMRRNPIAYGIDMAELRDDPSLAGRRRKLAAEAARTLRRCGMVGFDERTEELRSLDAGRIASQYYVGYGTVESYSAGLRPRGTEADALGLISRSGEFANVQWRDSESEELVYLRDNVVPCMVEKVQIGGPRISQGDRGGGGGRGGGGKGSRGGGGGGSGGDGGGSGGGSLKENSSDQQQSHAKANILLQAHVCRYRPADPALGNDLAYIAQQAARLVRALAMLALHRRWGHQLLVLLTLAKAIERRIWPFQHPLRQFDEDGAGNLPQKVLDLLESGDPELEIDELRRIAGDPAAIEAAVGGHRAAGRTIARLARGFPAVEIDVETAPLSRDVLRIRLRIRPDPAWEWNDRISGSSESFHVWVEDSTSAEMLHHEFIILTRRRVQAGEVDELSLAVPLADPTPAGLYVRAVSDRWLGVESVTDVPLRRLVRPQPSVEATTDLLPLRPLPITAAVEIACRPRAVGFLNPAQTQVFHALYHGDADVVLCAPAGAGKTLAAELALWRALRQRPNGASAPVVLYLAPTGALARERAQDWETRLAPGRSVRIVELAGEEDDDDDDRNDATANAHVIIATPERWDAFSRRRLRRLHRAAARPPVSLVIIDDIQLLARTPVLEAAIARIRHQPMPRPRLVVLSAPCANAVDLADWLGAPRRGGGFFNFGPAARPVPLELYVDGFPDGRGFSPLMQSMNRPIFLAIRRHCAAERRPALVFVPSRRQVLLTAQELISLCGTEEDDNPRPFSGFGEGENGEYELRAALGKARDRGLREAIGFGIGLHHAGLSLPDRRLVETLFDAGRIQVLIAAAGEPGGDTGPAWVISGGPRAHLVIVKGTQVYHAVAEAYRDADPADVLRLAGRAGRPGVDATGVARIMTRESRRDFYRRFLHGGALPVESSLHEADSLTNLLGAEIATGTISSKQDALDWISRTFFFRRLHQNPSYYGLDLTEGKEEEEEEEDEGVGGQRGGEEGRQEGGQEGGGEDQAQARDRAEAAAITFLARLVDDALTRLVEAGCVHVSGSGSGDVGLTPVGQAACRSRLSYRTVAGLVAWVPAATGSAADHHHHYRHGLLTQLALAAEFDDLPVRHNEDLVNAELLGRGGLATLPPPLRGLSGHDPHVKAYVLLQADLVRPEKLPSAHCSADQAVVLARAARVLRGSVDVLAELGRLDDCLEAVRLLQRVRTALPPKAAPASILPGIIVTSASSGTLPSLDELAAMTHDQLEGMASAMLVPSGDRAHFVRAALSLPEMKIDVAVIPKRVGGGGGREEEKKQEEEKQEEKEKQEEEKDKQRMITVVMTRRNAPTNRDGRVDMRQDGRRESEPLKSGFLTEGWFIVVGGAEEEQGGREQAGGGKPELLALKRVGFVEVETRVVPAIPSSWTGGRVDVWVMSDVYPGLERRVGGVHVG